VGLPRPENGVGLIRGLTGTNNSLVFHPAELQINLEAGSRPEAAMKDEERKAQLLSLWQQRPDGKHTENDVIGFYADMERAFPHLLDRRKGDPYRNLQIDLKGHIKERKRV
jgi:hypothetical protein